MDYGLSNVSSANALASRFHSGTAGTKGSGVGFLDLASAAAAARIMKSNIKWKVTSEND